MNSLWPAASRFLCSLKARPVQTCRNIDNIVAKLAQVSTRPYSVSSLPIRRRNINQHKGEPLSCISSASSAPWSLGIGAARTFASRRILTNWETLPESYKDKVGIHFRETDLSKAEVLKIFGKGIDVNNANRLLRVLHGRRVAGTLADPDELDTLGVWEKNAQINGLHWLRWNVPCDEVRNAGLRAEKELAEMEEEVIAHSEKMGLYRPSQASKTQNGKSEGAKSVYGESGLDYIRKVKKAEREAKEDEEEKKRKKQAAEIRQNTGTLAPILESAAKGKVELRRKGEHPWLKYYAEKAKVLPNTPPGMTMFQRLWPSALLTLAVLAVCILAPQIYTPPANSNRFWPDVPPAAATIMGIININALVFLAWHSPPFWRILNRYFMTAPGYPIPLSLLGNIFSHQQLLHVVTNMAVLFLVGTRLHDEVGRAEFLGIYVGAGVLGSFVSLTSWVVRSSFVSTTLGASGAISGVIGAYLWLNKNEPITFFGLIGGENSWLRMPCWLPLLLMIGTDAYCLSKWNKKPIIYDHWAHLGGFASGMVAAELIRKREARKRELMLERKRSLNPKNMLNRSP